MHSILDMPSNMPAGYSAHFDMCNIANELDGDIISNGRELLTPKLLRSIVRMLARRWQCIKYAANNAWPLRLRRGRNEVIAQSAGVSMATPPRLAEMQTRRTKSTGNAESPGNGIQMWKAIYCAAQGLRPRPEREPKINVQQFCGINNVHECAAQQLLAALAVAKFSFSFIIFRCLSDAVQL